MAATHPPTVRLRRQAPWVSAIVVDGDHLWNNPPTSRRWITRRSGATKVPEAAGIGHFQELLRRCGWAHGMVIAAPRWGDTSELGITTGAWRYTPPSI